MKRLAGFAAFALFSLFAAGAAATPITYVADLTDAESPTPTGSPGTGSAIVVIDPAAHTLSVHVVFSGLLGTTTASHIHCCTAAPGTGNAMVATMVPTFVGFPLGVTSGTYDNLFDLMDAGSWNPAFITAHGGTTAGAEAALLAGLAAGEAYLNIHTTAFPGGEIRGFLVPEPGSLALLGVALAGFAFARRRGSGERS